VLRLSVGPARSGKVLLVAACGLAIAFGVVLAAGAASLSGRLDSGTPGRPGRLFEGGSDVPSDPDRFAPLAGLVGDLLQLIGLCGVPIALLSGYLLLRALRRAAWLDGTRLHTRGALITRSADLARSTVLVDDRRLAVRDPITGATLRLPLRGLPAFELRALAGAVPDPAAAARLRRAAVDAFEV
jgi:hypothetical protein